MKNTRRTGIGTYGLGLLVCSVCVWYGVDWSRMLGIGGDNTQVYNFAKSYIDGFGFRYNPQLGFPGTQDNLYFPTFDFAYRALLWLAGQFASEAQASIKALYVVGTSAMFLVGAVALASVGVRPWLASIGGLAFVLTPYFGSRALTHDFLSLYVSAGSGAALALLIGTISAEQRWREFICRPIVILALALAGTCGLYYAFFTCLFAMFVGVIAAAWQRRMTPLLIAVTVPAVVLPLLVVTGYGPGVLDVLTGSVPQVQRLPMEQVFFGLNPAEATAVYARLPSLGWILDDYKALMARLPGATGLFEWPGLLLTTVIFACPLLVAVFAPAAGYWGRLAFISSLCIVFGMLYSIKGGLAYYFSLFVAPNIRATDRIMPFLTFFSIAVVLASVEGVRRSWPGRKSALFTSVAVVGLIASAYPNVGALAKKQQANLSAFGQRTKGTEEMLVAKNRARATRVLQIPHVAWPEQPPVRQFLPYSHQDPYILDPEGTRTKWSYGLAANEPAFQAVGDLLERQDGFVAGARSIGFDAIVLEKAAYDGSELQQWRSTIEGALGDGCIVFDDELRTLFMLIEPDDPSLCIGR